MPTTLLNATDCDDASAPDPNQAAATAATNPARFISKTEVLDRVCASYPSVWLWMREGRFPRSRELGGKAVWIENEIEEWIVNRPVRRLKGDR
jgi:predicted DNA-binding transcriptional regulator AlpA